MKKKLLLHICCAPDATYGIEYFSKGFDVTVFFYNPNIHPEAEYKLRLIELKRVARRYGVTMIEGDYNPNAWFEAVKGLENEPEGGKRCPVCFRMRLEETARVASELGFEAISTVLTISPKKDSELVNRIGRAAALKYGVEWIDANLKKGGGFKRSLELSSLFELYRQEYCGCVFSLREAEHIRRMKAIERIEKAELDGDMILPNSRFPGTSAETLFRKEIRDRLEERGGYNLKEFEFRFMGWRPLLAKVAVAKTGPEFTALPWVYSASASGRVRGLISDVRDIEVEGIKFKKIKLSKGSIELMARTDGPPIPLVFNDFPILKPIISVDREILNHLDAKMDVQLTVEFNERARSGILLAWQGEPTLAVTAPLDSIYNSPEGSRMASAIKLLELAEKGVEDVVFAFLGAELTHGIGFKKFIEVASEMFPRLERIIRLGPIGHGNRISLSYDSGFEELGDAFGDAVFPVVRKSDPRDVYPYRVAIVKAEGNPFYHTVEDQFSQVNEKLANSVIEVIRKYIKNRH